MGATVDFGKENDTDTQVEKSGDWVDSTYLMEKVGPELFPGGERGKMGEERRGR